MVCVLYTRDTNLQQHTSSSIRLYIRLLRSFWFLQVNETKTQSKDHHSVFDLLRKSSIRTTTLIICLVSWVNIEPQKHTENTIPITILFRDIFSVLRTFKHNMLHWIWIALSPSSAVKMFSMHTFILTYLCLYLWLAQVYYDYWILWPVLQCSPASCWPIHQLFHHSSCRGPGLCFQLAGSAIPSATTVYHRYLASWRTATVPYSIGSSKWARKWSLILIEKFKWPNNSMQRQCLG